MAIKYHNKSFNPEKLSRHNIDRQALAQIPEGSFVLDVGCATGFMGKYLKEKKACTVFGLEVREDEAKVAKKLLDGVLVRDIEDDSSGKELLRMTGNKRFDVILATSLIEHVSRPDYVIARLATLLNRNGKLVVTTPNIAHWSMRLSLLRGNFDYTDYGILDNTHLHFFTRKTFRELFEKQGLRVETLLIDAEGGGYPKLSLLLAPYLPNVFAYQMLIVARKFVDLDKRDRV